MKTSKSRPLFIFYLLVAYVLLQFSWWAYMLYELNFSVAILQENLSGLSHSNKVSASAVMARKIPMLLGEGIVFVIILGIGVWRIRKSINKEKQTVFQQQNFMLSVTHELKTPLASAKLYLQTLEARDLDRLKQKEIIGKAIKETNRLAGLVDKVLVASNLDTENFKLANENLDIAKITTNELARVGETLGVEHTIETEIPNQLFLYTDEAAYCSVLGNLVENAIKYSPKKSVIRVMLKEDSDAIMLTISDEGVGVLEIDRDRLFERFYRSGDEQTRKTKGTGLGLFIVSELLKHLDGSITMEPNSPKGSIFEVKLMKHGK